jgi:hypothetical protein
MGIYSDLRKLSEKKQDQPVETGTSLKIDTAPIPDPINDPIQEEKQTSKHDSKQSRKQASVLSRYHDSIVELLRKAVKFTGKEPFFGRFTPEEKAILKDIAYTYQRSGVKTSENEIARIAVNFIINDYNKNGKNSLLDKVLQALYE